ncbi:MAG: TIGR00297 family protein [Candidatus Hydrothermarchaeota archaeon]|jgi:uncharacterized protein (TIGR00297 family)|nr:TIGR00297 family protein [Candidatus Hydrothermarchaeota archaeon]
MNMVEELLAIVVGLIAGYAIYRLRILDLLGTVAAVILGSVIGILAGYEWLSLIVIFILIGSLSTRYRYNYKDSLGVAEKNHGKRNLRNVLANGLVPAAFAVLWFINKEASFGALLTAGYIAAVATVTGDTLSSEIGMLSKNNPVLITNFRPVPVGTDGGISLLGEIGGLIGALVIGISGYALGLASLDLSLTVALIGGTVGFHFDSILGAVLERRRLIGNATVNFLSSMFGGLVGLRIALSF